jgi:hypothetical protein
MDRILADCLEETSAESAEESTVPSPVLAHPAMLLLGD